MTPDPARLHRLLVRYWDKTLTAAESDELNRALTDPAAQDQFQQFFLEIAAAADGLALTPPAVAAEPPRMWTRRRVLGGLGIAAGVAAGVGVGVMGLPFGRRSAATAPFQLTAAKGLVSLLAANGRNELPLDGPVPDGALVQTRGIGSGVLLGFPGGTTVKLAGDSLLRVAESGWRLMLEQGGATTRYRADARDGRLVLSTDVVNLTGETDTAVHCCRDHAVTEIGVEAGRAALTAPGGGRLANVEAGEWAALSPDGAVEKRPLAAPPDEYAWDLAKPEPDGWHVGDREVAVDGPAVVRPRFWFDPAFNAGMCQIRSYSQWVRGFFLVYPDSVIRLRYRVARSGPGQVALGVRGHRTPDAPTGSLEWKAALAASRPGEWHWLRATARDLMAYADAPRFGPPWVAHRMVFSTHKADLGFEAAEFRVSRSGGPVGG